MGHDLKKTEATYAEISLPALLANLAQVRKISGERKIMLAVKANAYGHGAVQISKTVEQHKAADWLAVATVSEGVELRQAGIELPILKLSHAFDDEIEVALKNDITLTVVDEQTIRSVSDEASRLNVSAKVHLGIDTGMGRIGQPPEHALQLVKLIDSLPNVDIEGIFTHLPISDVPDGRGYTVVQLETFKNTVSLIESIRGKIPLVHAANSGAILSHQLDGTDLVRPGIMAYGYYPDPKTESQIKLQPVMQLKSRLSFIKSVAAGQTVGYGRTWKATEQTWIGTVCIGYADGYSRLNSNRGRVLINSRSYPVVGRVCMDQIMIDLGSQQPQVAVGDEVVLLGASGDQWIGADELADLMGTICYEVTCLITSRVPRCYLSA